MKEKELGLEVELMLKPVLKKATKKTEKGKKGDHPMDFGVVLPCLGTQGLGTQADYLEQAKKPPRVGGAMP